MMAPPSKGRSLICVDCNYHNYCHSTMIEESAYSVIMENPLQATMMISHHTYRFRHLACELPPHSSISICCLRSLAQASSPYMRRSCLLPWPGCRNLTLLATTCHFNKLYTEAHVLVVMAVVHAIHVCARLVVLDLQLLATIIDSGTSIPHARRQSTSL